MGEDAQPRTGSSSPPKYTQMKRPLPCNTMIIDFTHSFKDYDEILNFYGIWDYDCLNPECGARQHPMRRHAKYERSLVLWDASARRLKEERMEILRLKCSSCDTTHAVLTLDIIPFFEYTIYAFLALVSLCMEEEGSVMRTEKETGVSFQLLYLFLQIFHDYTENLMLFLRLEALWYCEGLPPDRQLLPLLLVKAPPWPQSSFFQRFQFPLFLHRSTVSYPLRFDAAIPT